MKKLKPVIVSDFWQIAGVPDLGKYSKAGQQPVDFGIWQAADGTWQVWSCIRRTGCGERGRLFYGWEAKNITDNDWKPMGIKMVADTSLGEMDGGIQSPYVIKKDEEYYMFYGDWNRICIAKSMDGKKFERFFYDDKKGHVLFEGPYENTRDCCIIKINDLYYCYYTGHSKNNWPQTAVFLRTSNDLLNWSEATVVCYGGSARTKTDWYGGDCECPQVINHNGSFILFRNQLYDAQCLNHQYCSDNPYNFGCDDDSLLMGALEITAPEIVFVKDKYYMASLMPQLKGIRICEIDFQEV